MSYKITNYYDYVEKDNVTHNNPHKDFPIQHPARVLISASSGSGKTNVLLNIIDKSECFNRILIFAGDDEEVLYKLMEDKLGGDDSDFLLTDNLDLLPPLEELEDTDELQTLIIFDDMMCRGRKDLAKITEYFIRARKKNCSIVFITQSYFATPKHIRDNVSDILLFKSQNNDDLDRIMRRYNFGGTGKTPESKTYNDTLLKVYNFCVNEPYGFLTICTKVDSPYKFYKNFEEGFDF